MEQGKKDFRHMNNARCEMQKGRDGVEGAGPHLIHLSQGSVVTKMFRNKVCDRLTCKGKVGPPMKHGNAVRFLG